MARNNTMHIGDGFTFRRAWGDLLLLLSDQEAGRMIKAICAHINGESAGKLLEDDPKLKRIADMIIRELEYRTRQYLKWKNRKPAANNREANDSEGREIDSEHHGTETAGATEPAESEAVLFPPEEETNPETP